MRLNCLVEKRVICRLNTPPDNHGYLTRFNAQKTCNGRKEEAMEEKTEVRAGKTACNDKALKQQDSWILVDAAPFRIWYQQHYGQDIGRKKKAPAVSKKETEEGEAASEEKSRSKHVIRKVEKRCEGHKLDQHMEEQFAGGKLMACISSRPGQCGRADGYILEGKELEFYMKKLQKKKGKGAAVILRVKNSDVRTSNLSLEMRIFVARMLCPYHFSDSWKLHFSRHSNKQVKSGPT
ncbi:hypothetical protein SUGI_0838440 [Cryptomeria japonica]|nr:hypothetical protein SUGI_0838440 [Cryptomeria japonica]